MENKEVKGRVTVIIQSSVKTTRELESDTHCLFNTEGNWYLGSDEEVEVFVVPSDNHCE